MFFSNSVELRFYLRIKFFCRRTVGNRMNQGQLCADVLKGLRRDTGYKFLAASSPGLF